MPVPLAACHCESGHHSRISDHKVAQAFDTIILTGAPAGCHGDLRLCRSQSFNRARPGENLNTDMERGYSPLNCQGALLRK